MKSKTVICIVILAGFPFLGISNAEGQKRIVESKSFSDTLSRAEEEGSEKQRNVETITEEYADGTIILRTTANTQIVSEERYRSLLKTERLGQIAETELIRIDDITYKRENGGPWLKEDRSPFESLRICCGLQSPTKIVSQVTVESVFLGNFPTDLYEKLTVSELKSGLETVESRYWIGLDGILLQEEEVRGIFSPRVVTNRRIVKYEFDPNIKIEAPIP